MTGSFPGIVPLAAAACLLLLTFHERRSPVSYDQHRGWIRELVDKPR
jgi:hypothetical protein